jgi:hypothetical protein
MAGGQSVRRLYRMATHILATGEAASIFATLGRGREKTAERPLAPLVGEEPKTSLT